MARSRSDRETGGRRVVWVVGASSGIGGEIARAFAEVGAVVCLSPRRRGHLDRLRKAIVATGGRAIVVPFDVTAPRQVTAAWKTVRAKAGAVDVLVNCAGVTVFKTFLATTPAEFQSIVATNLLGPAYCLKSVLPALVPELGYGGMEIADGMAASGELRRLLLGDGMPDAERARLREALRRYCELDTLGVVKLLGRLGDMAKTTPAA